MKRDEIIEHLKSRILSGDLAPGSFLPHRPELIDYCGASNVTVQRAVNRLVEEGFLCSCGSRGIMISKTPPHRFRFGILVPSGSRPDENDYDSRWFSIEEAIREIEEKHPQYRFIRYHLTRETIPQAAEYQRLLADLRNALLAGVIVPYTLEDELLRPLDGYPVVLHEPRNSRLIHAVSLNHDFTAMAALAVEELKRRGARKIALIMNAELNPIFTAEIEKFLANSDVITHREWIHGVSRSSRGAVWTERIIRLLFMPGMPEVPDGLAVLNENLLLHVLEALGAIGKTIGGDIQLCSHCNLPAGRPLLNKVNYVAFSARRVLLDSIRYLNQFQQLNREFFEHEVLVAPTAVRRPSGDSARAEAAEPQHRLRKQETTLSGRS